MPQIWHHWHELICGGNLLGYLTLPLIHVHPNLKNWEDPGLGDLGDLGDLACLGIASEWALSNSLKNRSCLTSPPYTPPKSCWHCQPCHPEVYQWSAWPTVFP